ncbi:MAG: hypothetical protein JW726_12420 [Anaerolineales bacterium]|nr:hypothetical protein [Anaerolineales bacterium]
MDTSKAGLVICLAVVFGFSLPILLYLAFRDQALRGELNAMRRAVEAARKPLKQEADDLAELSRLVSELKPDEHQPEEKTNHG